MKEAKAYNHQEIEAKWQKEWEKSGIYKTPEDATPQNKFYILPQLPYPSGAGLHVGHAEVYSACDIYARFQRLKGKKILQAVGWDAFGLPAENYAIKSNTHPRVNTEKAIDVFRSQIKSLGVSVDWSREVGSHNPDYYKWTQWFFLLFLKRDLAYRKEQNVNWCPSCQTVLANEQVTTLASSPHADSQDLMRVCERCETPVEQKAMKQWFIKITDYADRLIDDLDNVDWPEESIKRQRDWIGRTFGLTIEYEIKGLTEPLSVYTTRPDTFFGASFIAVAPDSEFVEKHLDSFPNKAEVSSYVEKTRFKTEVERMSDKSKTGVDTGFYAVNHLNGKNLPIFVSDFVIGSVGTGAVVGVPGSDKRDFGFAQEKNLDVARVVVGSDGDKSPITRIEQVQEEFGKAINSDFLDDLPSEDAKEKIMDYFEEKGWGKRTVNYKLRDWSVSRQRYWGSPIPVVYDPKGKPHPVRDDDLPVLLPEDVDFRPTGESPLKQSQEFQKDVEEKYGEGWKREVDTLDTFMCSSWYYYRYLDPHNDEVFASKESLKKWMPVDFYLGGSEHVNGHLLYSRFFTKVLYDEGLIDFDEPFLVHRHQGTILGGDGKIMSKRHGNVVNPTDVINEFGADALRLFEMFLGPLEASKPWGTEGIKGIDRYLKKVFRFGFTYSSSEVVTDSDTVPDSTSFHLNGKGVDRITSKFVNEAESLMRDLKFNVVIAKLMQTLNSYEKKIPSKASWEAYLIVLSPLAPHLAEELWQNLGHSNSIHTESWPEVRSVEEDEVQIVVQINGKLRALLEVAKEKTEDEDLLKEMARTAVSDHLQGIPAKTVVVKGKLVNFVVEE